MADMQLWKDLVFHLFFCSLCRDNIAKRNGEVMKSEPCRFKTSAEGLLAFFSASTCHCSFVLIMQ